MTRAVRNEETFRPGLLAFTGNIDLAGNFVENRCYGTLELTNRHLISMAYQIALGMVKRRDEYS